MRSMGFGRYVRRPDIMRTAKRQLGWSLFWGRTNAERSLCSLAGLKHSLYMRICWHGCSYTAGLKAPLPGLEVRSFHPEEPDPRKNRRRHSLQALHQLKASRDSDTNRALVA